MGFFKKLIDYVPTISAGKTIYQTLTGQKEKAIGSAVKGVVGGLTLVAPFIPGAGGVAGFVAKQVITKPVATIKTGALILGTAGLISSSSKVRKGIKDAPKTIFTGGQALGKTIEGEKPFTSVKEGLVAGGVLGGVAGLVGGGLILKDKLKDKTPTLTDHTLVPEKPIGIESTPITPQTTTITTGVKKRKRYKKKIIPSVKQSVRVNIVNRNINKRYLKGDLLIC